MEGGCLCRALRYRVDAAPLDTGYCHCSLCRRSTGAPTLAWVSVPAAAFAYTAGEPAVYHSSSWGQREFCAICGTQICYRDQGPLETVQTVEINSGCLDDPALAPPRHHIYDADRIAWFDTADKLPRHPGAKPEDEPA